MSGETVKPKGLMLGGGMDWGILNQDVYSLGEANAQRKKILKFCQSKTCMQGVSHTTRLRYVHGLPGRAIEINTLSDMCPKCEYALFHSSKYSDQYRLDDMEQQELARSANDVR